MKQGYLAAGFLAGLALSLSLWNSLQAQEQKAEPTPAIEPEELPYAPPPPPPAKPVTPPGRSASTPAPVSASASATTIITPAPAGTSVPAVPETTPTSSKRRLPLWTTSSKQGSGQAVTPATLVGLPPATGNPPPAEEPLFGPPPEPPPATRPVTQSYAAPVPATSVGAIPAPAATVPPPRAGETTPPLPPSYGSSTIVDVYVGVQQLEAGKPLLTGVLMGENVEFGGKKFLKFVKPDNPQEYWLLDAKVIVAARFKN